MKRVFRKVIESNLAKANNSKKDLESLFSIIFSNNGILAEDTDGIRINKHSYASVYDRILESSAALHEKIGATHSYVALYMENGVDWIVAFWSILRSGNKPYLINCRHPKNIILSALKALEIKYIVGKEPTELDGEFIDISTLKTEKRFDGEFEDEIALSTSSTSMNETICFYTGVQLFSQITNVRSFMGKYPEIISSNANSIKQLAFLPFYHIFGLVAVYFWFTFFGQTFVFLKDYSAETILKTCQKHEVTHIFAVPLLWHTIENAVLKKIKQMDEKKQKKFYKGISFCSKLQNIFPRTGMLLSQKIMHEVTDELFGNTIRFCINGGSYLRSSALELLNGIGYNLHNGYGMSEIGISSVELRMRPKHKNLNSIGAPFASVEYKIKDSGELMVKGSSICSRIMFNGKEQIITDWFDTGDIVECIDGFYYIKGRKGDVIIGENGENINPDVIEQNFRLPQAENISVLGTSYEGKEVLTLIVQISKYMTESKKNLLYSNIEQINMTLPLTSRIQKIYYTTDMIMAPTAIKVSRKWLLHAIENNMVELSDYIKTDFLVDNDEEYNEELLSSVINIVAGVLDVDPSSIQKDTHIMLDLGASSIQYFSILSALADEFSIISSNKDEFCYTPHDMCKYIERQL